MDESGPATTAPAPAPAGTVWAGGRAVAIVLIAAASAVLWWAPVMGMGTRWVEDGTGGTGYPVPGAAADFGLLAAGVGLTVVVSFLQRWRWYLAPLGALGGAGLAAIAVHQLTLWPGDVPPGGTLLDPSAPPYMVWTLVAAVTLVLGWLLYSAAVYGDRRGPARFTARTLLAAGLVLVAAVGTAVVAAPAYGSRHGIDHHTAAPPPAGPRSVEPPRYLSRPAWTTQTDGAAYQFGRYVVLTADNSVRVLDALTGRERWHYRRTMYPGYTPTAQVSGDGRTLLTVWTRFDPDVVLAGFDLATGRLLWSSAERGDSYTAGPPGGLEGFTEIGRTLLMLHKDGLVTGIDRRSGRQLWQWRTPDGCDRMQYLPAGDRLAVSVDCSGGQAYGGQVKQPDGSFRPAATRVLGVSTVDGKTRWDWTPPSPLVGLINGPSGAEPGLALVGDSLRVPTYGDGDIELDPASGAPRHPAVRHPAAPSGRRLFTVLRGQSASVYLGDQRSRGASTAIDDTGRTVWARDIPELDGRSVTASTTVGDLGYALVVPDPDDRLPVGAYRTRRLVVIDLRTGTVRADAEVTLPGSCGCFGLSYPSDVQLSATGGGVLLAYRGDDRVVHLQGYA